MTETWSSGYSNNSSETLANKNIGLKITNQGIATIHSVSFITTGSGNGEVFLANSDNTTAISLGTYSGSGTHTITPSSPQSVSDDDDFIIYIQQTSSTSNVSSQASGTTTNPNAVLMYVSGTPPITGTTYNDYSVVNWSTPNGMEMTIVYEGSGPSGDGVLLPPPYSEIVI